MDEFNSQINDAPMRKKMPIMSLRVRMHDKTKQYKYNDPIEHVNIRKATSNTIKKSYVSYETSGGKMRYGSNSQKDMGSSKRINAINERADFKRLVVKPEILEHLAEE